MITNKLSVLLAEKKMRNNVLAKKANISENTISSISQNNIRMIQLETLDKICKVLEIAPSEFFDFVPIFIDYNFDIFEKEKEEYAKLTLDVSNYDTLIGSICYKSKDPFVVEVPTTKDRKTHEKEQAFVFIDFILDSDEHNVLSEIKKLSVVMQIKIKDDITNHVQKILDSVIKEKYPSLNKRGSKINYLINIKLF